MTFSSVCVFSVSVWLVCLAMGSAPLCSYHVRETKSHVDCVTRTLNGHRARLGSRCYTWDDRDEEGVACKFQPPP